MNNSIAELHCGTDTCSSEIKVAASQTASSDITHNSSKYHVPRLSAARGSGANLPRNIPYLLLYSG
jgi:hypothetical protein